MLYGLAFFVPVISWTGVYVGPVPWLILAAAEAAYIAGLGRCADASCSGCRFAPVWVAAHAGCCRRRRATAPRSAGFPWARLAFSQADSPVRWFAALGGAPLVTFVVALGGAGLAIGLRQLAPTPVAGGGDCGRPQRCSPWLRPSSRRLGALLALAAGAAGRS